MSRPPIQKVWLKGPITITEHILPELNKHVYILGDDHVQFAECPPATNGRKIYDLDEFVEWTVDELSMRHPTAKLDLYLECAHGKACDFINSYIGDLSRKYQHCQTKQNGASICKRNVRLQNIDVRFTENRSSWLSEWEETINLAWHLVDKDVSDEKSAIDRIRYYTQRFESLLLLDSNALRRELVNNKIVKQLSHVQHSGLARLIEEIFLERMQQVMEVTMEAVGKLKKSLSKSRPRIRDVLKDLKNVKDAAIDVGVYIMDAYALARMFRTWNIRDSQEPSFIMVYVGDFHANNYRNFFDFISANLETTTNVAAESKQDFHHGTIYQCLSLAEFRLPFFSSPIDDKIYAGAIVTENDLKEEHEYVSRLRPDRVKALKKKGVKAKPKKKLVKGKPKKKLVKGKPKKKLAKAKPKKKIAKTKPKPKKKALAKPKKKLVKAKLKKKLVKAKPKKQMLVKAKPKKKLVKAKPKKKLVKGKLQKKLVKAKPKKKLAKTKPKKKIVIPRKAFVLKAQPKKKLASKAKPKKKVPSTRAKPHKPKRSNSKPKQRVLAAKKH